MNLKIQIRARYFIRISLKLLRSPLLRRCNVRRLLGICIHNLVISFWFASIWYFRTFQNLMSINMASRLILFDHFVTILSLTKFTENPLNSVEKCKHQKIKKNGEIMKYQIMFWIFIWSASFSFQKSEDLVWFYWRLG